MARMYLMNKNLVSIHSGMATTLEDYLVELSSANDWHGVIEAGNLYGPEETTKFLWAWPTVASLNWLKRNLIENHIGNILSVGCGSGLLEWLICKTSGVNVVGLELDKSWWKSAYAPTTFIDIKFTEKHITNDFLNKCMQADPSQFALLFCYFNNRTAFLEYMRAYSGNLVIIVGPKSEQHIVTDPNPLKPNFESDEWTLLGYCQFNDQFLNCMSIFKRTKYNEEKI